MTGENCLPYPSTYHVHLQCSFRVEGNSAYVTNVLRDVVNVFVGFQSRQVLELLRAVINNIMYLIIHARPKSIIVELTKMCIDRETCWNG